MKKTLIVVAAMVVFIAAYFLGRHDNSVASAQQEIAKTPETNLDDNKTTKGTPVLKFGVFNPKTSAKFGQPLPPGNLPLAKIYGELRQRADDGNGQAACRLAIELIRCRHFNARAKNLITDPSDHKQEGANSLNGQLLSENSQDEERLMILEKNKNCENISENHYKQIFKYLRQGAYAAEPDALIPYISGDGLPMDFSRIRSHEFDVWRSDALPLAQSAMRTGDPASVLLLASAYQGDDDFFSGMVSNDPFQAEVMNQLYSRLFAIPSSVRANQLTAEQNRMAINEAEQLFQQRFRGQTVPRALSVNPAIRFTSPKKDDRAPCEHQ
ncbi:MAG: hypothetical protein ACREPB_14640 [Arenimonas sp.]